MPRKCCAPGCKSNYVKSEVSVFLFPKDKERRDQWIRAIHRKGFTPSDKAVLCVKHFVPEFVIREDILTRPDGTELKAKRERPKLSKDALPSIFPNQPKYLSREIPTKLTSPEERRKRLIAQDEVPASFSRFSLLLHPEPKALSLGLVEALKETYEHKNQGENTNDVNVDPEYGGREEGSFLAESDADSGREDQDGDTIAIKEEHHNGITIFLTEERVQIGCEDADVEAEPGDVYYDNIKSEDIEVKEEPIDPLQEPSETNDKRGEKRRHHSRSSSSKKQKSMKVKDGPKFDGNAEFSDDRRCTHRSNSEKDRCKTNRIKEIIIAAALASENNAFASGMLSVDIDMAHVRIARRNSRMTASVMEVISSTKKEATSS